MTFFAQVADHAGRRPRWETRPAWAHGNVWISRMGLLAFLYLAPLCMAADDAPSPVMVCPRIASAPIIDGEIVGAEWGSASRIGNYVSLSGNRPAREQTEAYVCHDPAYLYLAFRCHDSRMEKVKAGITARDGNVYNDDCVEVFVDPGPSRKHYYQLLVNALGTLQDIKWTEWSQPDWNAECAVAATRGDTFWSVEMAIPFKAIAMETPAPGGRLGINFTRTVNRLDEYSCWSHTGDNFHVPGRFGDLVFADGGGVDFRILGWSQERCDVEVRVGSETSRALRVEVLTESEEGGTAGMVREVAPEGLGQPLRIPYLLPASWSDYQAHIEVREQANGALLYRSPRVAIAGSTGAKLDKARIEINQLKAEMLLLKAGASDNGYLVVPAAPFEMIRPTALPGSAKAGAPIRVRASRGEYEPAACLLYTGRDLRGIRVELAGDLRGDADVIGKSDVDIRVVKWWYQGGHGQRYEKTVHVPELLLKDDSLVGTDADTMRNVMHFDGLPVDGPNLKPFDLPAYRNKKVWMTIRVPDSIAPGLYQAMVGIAPENAPAARIPIEVEVLPIALRESERLFSIYYYSPQSGSSVAWELLGQELKDMKAHGLNSASILAYDLGFGKDASGEWSVALGRLQREMEHRRDAGLTRSHILGMQTHKPPFPTRLFRGPWKDDNEPDPGDVEKLSAIARSITASLDKNAFPPPYLLGIDEPNFDYTGQALDRCAKIFRIVKNAGGNTATALDVVASRKLGSLIDMPIYNAKSVFPLFDRPRTDKPDKTEMVYWHPLENPVHDRLHFGVMVWKAGLDGACPYAYRHTYKGGAWYDESAGKPKTDSGVNRNIMYTYPGRTGPIPTIQWEATREGIDDIRYLENLAAWVDRARAAPQGPELDAAITRANRALSLPGFSGNDYVSFLEGLRPSDFDDLRTELITCIMGIRDALGVNGT